MKTLRVAGLSIDPDKVKELDYDTLMKMALNTKEYYLKPNAKKMIAAEFKKHGIRRTNSKQG